MDASEFQVRHGGLDHWTLVRMILGGYLLIHFSHLIPWAGELFSNAGMLSDAGKSPLAYAFPNILVWLDTAWFAHGFVIAGYALSLMLIFGWRRRLAAACLWYIWACLYGRNPLIGNPGMPYVGWMLLAYSVLPTLSAAKDSSRARQIHAEIVSVAWILLALGYTYSGLTKLISPSWVDGSTVSYVLTNPLARCGWATEFLLSLPDKALRVLTWSVLGFEILFAPLALIRAVRPLIWIAMFAMHCGLILLIDFADLSLGMIVIHLFVFDQRWLYSLSGYPFTRLTPALKPIRQA